MTTTLEVPAALDRPATLQRGGALADVALLTRRAVQHQLRSVETLLLGAALPVMVMLMFVYVFGGALSTGKSGLSYVDYVVPGVILVTAGYGAANTAQSVTADMTSGVVDRFRSLPVTAWAVPAGHVVASLVKNLVTTAIVIGVALLVGFRPQASAAGWIAAVGVIALYVLALTWVAAAVGMVAGSVETASAFSFFILFLPYVSSAFVPVETMPAVLRTIAEHQPITPTTDALRALLLGTPVGSHGWVAVAWWVGLLLLAAPAAGLLFRRRTKR